MSNDEKKDLNLEEMKKISGGGTNEKIVEKYPKFNLHDISRPMAVKLK